jgi:NAD(P)-dependent dehydrogenase (short-subunit alcohol dehydrogenase family)
MRAVVPVGEGRLRRWTARDMPSLSGRTCIVTGANSGLGFHAAVELARCGAHVVLACREHGKYAGAAATLRQRVPGASVEFIALDLASLDSVRAFATQFGAQHRQLDLLCNNAGVMALPPMKTQDGVEMQFGTNHLGHFALTGLLLDRLAAAPAARVVTMASQAHLWTRNASFDRPDAPIYDKWDAYSRSKLANLLFTFELDRRLKKAGLGIVAAAAHPGFSSTNLGYAGPTAEGSRVRRWAMQLGNALLAQPAAMGALPMLHAATHPDVQGGDYIGPDGWRQMRGYPCKVRCRSSAHDERIAVQLWTLSEQLSGQCYPRFGRC